jgi:hypothetical protein
MTKRRSNSQYCNYNARLRVSKSAFPVLKDHDVLSRPAWPVSGRRTLPWNLSRRRDVIILRNIYLDGKDSVLRELLKLSFWWIFRLVSRLEMYTELQTLSTQTVWFSITRGWRLRLSDQALWDWGRTKWAGSRHWRHGNNYLQDHSDSTCISRTPQLAQFAL